MHRSPAPRCAEGTSSAPTPLSRPEEDPKAALSHLEPPDELPQGGRRSRRSGTGPASAGASRTPHDAWAPWLPLPPEQMEVLANFGAPRASRVPPTPTRGFPRSGADPTGDPRTLPRPFGAEGGRGALESAPNQPRAANWRPQRSHSRISGVIRGLGPELFAKGPGGCPSNPVTSGSQD